MHLAIDYLTRKKLFRELFGVPCSLFVQERGTPNRIVITINEEFKPSSFYCVKHWHISRCRKSQAIPSFTEYRVTKKEVFSHQAVILSDYQLMPYYASSIPFHANLTHRPMDTETYNHYYDHYLNTFKHQEMKVNWVWSEFISTYVSHMSWHDGLFRPSGYISSHKSDAEIASDQRSTVAAVYPEIWQCWIKWCRCMMYLDGIPGELVFLGDYQGEICTEKSPQSSSLLFLP